MTAHTKKAGTNAKYGASLKTKRSARSGNKSSLKNNLIPSAKVCNKPHGPALFGPMRLPMPAIALRSNHTINMVATSPMTKTTTTLSKMIKSGVQIKSPMAIGSSPISEVELFTVFPPSRRSPNGTNQSARQYLRHFAPMRPKQFRGSLIRQQQSASRSMCDRSKL